MDEEQELEGYEESDEYVAMTSAELLDKLKEAWINERMAPELLNSQDELVECMIEQLDAMERNLKTGKRNPLVNSMHGLEMERVRFLINSYIRCRLGKIEKYVIDVLQQHKARGQEDLPLLSRAELEYAREYADGMENHLKSTILKFLPTNLQNFDEAKELPKPNKDKYVFIRVNDQQDQVLIDDDETTDLNKGARHIVRYSFIASLLSEGSVSLT
ncbi:DNA replication complex GINS protein SLD5 [Trichoplax sp. H2]|uniref:DNA replication complex GINS protein SLD5 n=1 Tax=Trichoplax adhaerens TaxID=10228 RepID=B3RSV2_TRIAD|nr:hypothetical protein TRIADDRAFT_23024 [Trichoplax adhaerens]EDV26588.1 hypothetical protein TRIADDRAFT_23024 [Trichoplax adhaerens]RDD45758.1 DNA replication complex GINS protein SLD5 [Trichoplax sp. H2]|eukprot:XP_002110584.1 hypothetical protein TRIADDRAFT_23024 [Trichoplax adhaerens]